MGATENDYCAICGSKAAIDQQYHVVDDATHVRSIHDDVSQRPASLLAGFERDWDCYSIRHHGWLGLPEEALGRFFGTAGGEKEKVEGNRRGAAALGGSC